MILHGSEKIWKQIKLVKGKMFTNMLLMKPFIYTIANVLITLDMEEKVVM